MYIYKRLKEEHLDLVEEMNNNFRSELIDRNSTHKFLKNENHWLYVCLYKKTIIAFAYAYVLERLDDKKMMYIHEVAVMENHQQKGVANEMMLSIKEEAFEEGVDKIFLMAQKNNIAACKLYDKINGETNDEEDVVYFFKNIK